MLVAVPPPGGQGEGAPARRRRTAPCLSLTPTQRKRLRAALKNLRAAYGSWECLAEVMGMSPVTLQGIAGGRDAGSPGTVQRAAKAAGITVEQLLGGLAAADRCPTCGRSG
ncbi:helix-turn-helix transcriptional regulator [Sorangium sp. So ce327]|uniref:helix-turn-helix domain-containing protein n=1 Tax=Sorangium sp. So ce327 TaxID=3133301 RepID=UPI003F62B386